MTYKEYIKICDYLKQIIIGTKFENNLYIVGGAVRTELMGLDEIEDIDLSITIKDGAACFIDFLDTEGYATKVVYKYNTFGSCMFKLKEFYNTKFEIKESTKLYDDNIQYSDTLLDDTYCRDFTINSIYYNVSTNEYIDPTGKGIEDVNKRVLRATNENPDFIFKYDALRILRAVRFSFSLNLTIGIDLFSSMKKNSLLLNDISKERITKEFNKILLLDHPDDAMNVLKDLGAIEYIIPELVNTYNMKQGNKHDKDVWGHSIDVLGKVAKESKSLELRMSALLHDIGKTVTKTIDDKNGNIHFYGHDIESGKMVIPILERLKYSNKFISIVSFFTKNHMYTKPWGNDVSVSDEKIRNFQYICGDKFDDMLILIDCDNRSHAHPYILDKQKKILSEKTDIMIKKGEDMLHYKLPVNGFDVMNVKNIKNGVEVKKYLKVLFKFALKNPKMTREEMLSLLKTINKNNI